MMYTTGGVATGVGAALMTFIGLFASAGVNVGTGVCVDCAVTRVCGSTEVWITASPAGTTAAVAETSETTSSLARAETLALSSRCFAKNREEKRESVTRARMKPWMQGR